MSDQRRPNHYWLMNPWYNQKYVKKRMKHIPPTNTTSEIPINVECDDVPMSSNDTQSVSEVHSNDVNLEADTSSGEVDEYISSNEDEQDVNNYDFDAQSDSDSLIDVPEAPEANPISNDSSNPSSEGGGNFEPAHCSMRREFVKFKDDIRINEVLFMILKFYTKYNIPQQGVEHLLQMFNTLSQGGNFPENFDDFKQHFPNKCAMERVYFCRTCQYGYNGNPGPEVVCPVTNCRTTQKDFFMVFSVEHQIRETITKYSKHIEDYEKLVVDQDICDINKGLLAQTVMSRENCKFITLSANEDSAAAYKSTTKKPLYPLFLAVNNLPPYLRFDKNNLIIAALWFNTGKPDMALFHKNFIQQSQQLREGIQINFEVYKIIILQNCLDSVGRCEVFCSKQFNGKFGCTICLHPGKVIQNQVRYPYHKSKLRDDRSTRQLMLQVHNSKKEESIFGIKGLSALTGIPDFDIIKGLPPDYMHMVNLGITKLVWELLLEGDAETKSQQYYIGNYKQLIEQRLQAIRLPSIFPRRIRSLVEYSKFKASEWETILFHCVYPCFNDLLPSKYMNHLMLLSTSVFLLIELKIPRITLSTCGKYLDQFVKDFETHYGSKHMVYNVHLITHLVQTVRNLGALWNSSLYPYENGNGMLIGFQTSKNNPVLQVSNKFVLNRICNFTEVKNSSINNWITKLSGPVHHNVEFSHNRRCMLLTNADIPMELRDVDFNEIGRYYYNGIRICTEDVCKNFKYDDSFVSLNGQFMRIHRLLIDSNKNGYIFGFVLSTSKVFENMFIYKISNNLKLCRINDSLRLAISVEIPSREDDSSTCNYISLCKSKTQID